MNENENGVKPGEALTTPGQNAAPLAVVQGGAPAVASGPKPLTMEQQFDTELSQLISQAGTLEFTEAEYDILFAPVDPEAVEIRPDGLIYLPWMEYVTRLRKAFRGSWAFLPKGMPKTVECHVIWPFWLLIKGKPYGLAIGEQEYQPSNRSMSYTDACEGAKSNALMRLCKGIGMTLELWQPSFIRAWIAEHAHQVEVMKYDAQAGKKVPKLEWRKKTVNGNGAPKGKDEPKGKTEKGPDPAKPSAPPKTVDTEVVKPGTPTPQNPPPPATPSGEEKPKAKRGRPTTKEAPEATEESGNTGASDSTPKAKTAPKSEKDALVDKLKARVEEKNIPVAAFKVFLQDYGLVKKRKFVDLNQFGKLSLHEGDLEDLKMVDTHFLFVLDKFFEYAKTQGKALMDKAGVAPEVNGQTASKKPVKTASGDEFPG